MKIIYIIGMNLCEKYHSNSDKRDIWRWKNDNNKRITKTSSKFESVVCDDRDYDSDSGIDDICKWVEEGSDVNRFNLERLAKDIDLSISQNYKYIILDYPFGHRHNLIGSYVDFSIFIDTSLDIALARRIIRDYDITSIKNVFEDVKQYLLQGRNAYLPGLDGCKNDAD